ncbi:MAG TPA: hypothetical protein VGD37_22285 [Kofleriaceae bacterium]
MRWLIPAVLACGCSGKPVAPVTGGAAAGTGCDSVRGKVEQLYRAEARTREPARVDEAVADNTAMVMTDCAKAPAKVTACIAAASTVNELEARCLAPLDDEGTEGDRTTH